ncbi:hypothetical protein [Streptomyces sp. MAR4 CNX-425]|uniref:hypothetical protein n=1 Tax=Streptomyces sp. MAR4 CNX-425 TaxID=3406343 RepID=UPI003B509158
MQTDERPSGDGSGRDDGHGHDRDRSHGRDGDRGHAAARGDTGSRDAYEDERDEAIDADPQLRDVGRRARLRRRAGRRAGDDQAGGPHR